MDNQDLYQENDLIVRFSRIYQIKKIKKQKRVDKNIELVYYQPKYPRPAENKLQLTIPLQKMADINVRGLIKKSSLDGFLKQMKINARKKTKQSIQKQKANLEQAKTAIKENNLERITKHIALLWSEKNQTDTINHTKKRVLESMLNKIKEEVAAVYDISLEKSQEKIYKFLPTD